MRLNELAAHGWDVRVGLDPDAGLHADAAELVLEHYTDGMSFLLGYSGKADAVDGSALVDLGGYGLVVDDQVSLTKEVGDPTATFSGPRESFVRLMSGRLKPEHTPAEVDVTGNVTLDDLRRVFPGY